MHEQGKEGSIVSLICDSGERYAHTYHNDEWLDANEQLFSQAQTVPDINAGSGGSSKPSPDVSLGGLDPQEFAARFGVDPRYLTTK